jgi:hypothetical protein
MILRDSGLLALVGDVPLRMQDRPFSASATSTAGPPGQPWQVIRGAGTGPLFQEFIPAALRAKIIDDPIAVGGDGFFFPDRHPADWVGF